jgi:hypothetical protein
LFGVKILKFFDADTWIRNGDSSDPGWKKVGSGIRDKHPGCATLAYYFLKVHEQDKSKKRLKEVGIKVFLSIFAC